MLLAGIAEEVGVSDAIGAFMAGLILAESPARRRIERAVLPLRDTFAAVFFFAFGLTIDPGDLGAVAIPIAAAVLTTFALNVVAGILTARLYRFGRRAAANIGLTILARGEFSLILAALALEAGLDSRIGPFVAGYVLILALGAPILASQSKALSRLIPTATDRTPNPLVDSETRPQGVSRQPRSQIEGWKAANDSSTIRIADSRSSHRPGSVDLPGSVCL